LAAEAAFAAFADVVDFVRVVFCFHDIVFVLRFKLLGGFISLLFFDLKDESYYF